MHAPPTQPRLNRYTTRMPCGAARPPQPNYRAIANRCVRQLIRSHPRMARLWPELFDYAAVDREAARREELRQLEAEILPALDKIYGKAPSEA